MMLWFALAYILSFLLLYVVFSIRKNIYRTRRKGVPSLPFTELIFAIIYYPVFLFLGIVFMDYGIITVFREMNHEIASLYRDARKKKGGNK